MTNINWQVSPWGDESYEGTKWETNSAGLTGRGREPYSDAAADTRLPAPRVFLALYETASSAESLELWIFAKKYSWKERSPGHIWVGWRLKDSTGNVLKAEARGYYPSEPGDGWCQGVLQEDPFRAPRVVGYRLDLMRFRGSLATLGRYESESGWYSLGNNDCVYFVQQVISGAGMAVPNQTLLKGRDAPHLYFDAIVEKNPPVLEP